MDSTRGNVQITEGTDVYGSDGDKVGSVVAVQPSYVVVEKGFFFPTDYYIPTSAVASYDDGRVYLAVTKDEALNQGWDTEPTGDAVVTTGTTTVADTRTTTAPYATDAVETTVDTTATAAAPARGAGITGRLDEDDNPFEHYEDTERTHVDAEQGVVVPVHEEELTAAKRQREIGEVEIEKDVVQEQRTIEVPVTEERVRVERRVVDRPVDASEAAFREESIEVPVRGEEVELQKRTKVVEEVEVGKEAVQRTEQVSGTVRREEVRIDEVDPGQARRR